VGLNAGSGQTGNRVFLAGQSAGKFTTQADLIVIGDNAFASGTSAAPNSTASFAGMICIGSGAGAVASTASTTGGANGLTGSILIGLNAATAAVDCGSNIIVGSNAAASVVGLVNSNPFYANVIIGSEAVAQLSPASGTFRTLTNNVVIGKRACYGSLAHADSALTTSVILGADSCLNSFAQVSNGGNITSSVVIGYQAAQSLASAGAFTTQNNVIIGSNCIQSTASNITDNTLVGFGILADAGTFDSNVIVGSSSRTGSLNNTFIGTACSPSVTPGSRNILIGNQAGSSLGAGYNDTFALETKVGATRRTLLAGDLNLGNLIVGNSNPATDRTTSGTNTLKLLNGTSTGAVTGGGFFYVNAGALHWVGSAGTDTTVAPA